ncbi:MerR family transcriptional regulator [Pelagibacterium nitratireducens]|uniref:MerR family transcriptional regulator n=1 Tax=Pelagibacterium nitratireducens TaxID=1046114 RepID=A0ABZ2I6E2_9HYPH
MKGWVDPAFRVPQPLTIGKLAAAGEAGAETIRFYQRKGLLQQPAREGCFRHYGTEDVRSLRFIRQAQSAGFTLEEIKERLELDAEQDHAHAHARARELAIGRIRSPNDKIADLQRARDALRNLAHDCGEGSSGPCPILASLVPGRPPSAKPR